MSFPASIQSRPRLTPAVWLGAKMALVAIAVVVLSLMVVEVEASLGIIPPDNAMTWLDGGE
jgi:hypothetical protein